jgi:amidase
MMRRAARVAVLGLGLAGCSAESTTSAPAPVPTVEPVDPADFLDRSLRDQVAAMETTALSCKGLSEAYGKRIDERDPAIHAVIARDPKAASTAATLDASRGGGALLQCAVMLVKDNVDTAGLETTAGSLALADNVPAADATVVERLRAAHALVLGKTNLSEWANFRGYGSTSGWSSVGGQTNNGFDPAYNPCGSSSGSGAAVAAGLASAALGTETDGSIVCPSSINGIVGFKPTVGLVSRYGVVPISHTQDTVGPMAKNVGDAARLLTAIAGKDSHDPATDAIPSDMDLDFEKALAGASLEGKRLGVVDTLMGYDAALDGVFNAQLARIEAAGAMLVHVMLPRGSMYGNAELTVLLYEFKADLNAYLAAHPVSGQPATLAELIDFNDANAPEVMPYFGQELFVQAEATTGLDAQEYLMAKDSAHTVVANGIDAVLAAESLDAFVAPTTGPAFMTNYVSGDSIGGSASGPAAVAGYPHLTVPMGSVSGLPVGLSIFAGRWQDAKVLALGQAYESLPD